MEALQKAEETFEQAQQEVVQAQMDLDKLMQEAPLPGKPVPQVNVSLVKTSEALTGKHVEPRRRATAGAPGTGDPGVESIDSDLFGPSGPGGRCCIG